MATAFADIDNRIPFTLKPQPNVRVAFSATPAIAAVRAAGQGTADTTLDEIASSKPLTHEHWLQRVAQHAELCAELDGLPKGSSDDEIDRLALATHDLLTDILLTPAADVAALQTKLDLYSTEAGHELGRAEPIGRILADDAKRLLPAITAVADHAVTIANEALAELSSLARAVVATARRHLSPSMYAAFLDWGEAAARFSGTDPDVADDTVYVDANIATIRAIAEKPARNEHDVALKHYLLAVENAGCSGIGPVDAGSFDGVSVSADRLMKGLVADVVLNTPLTIALDQLAAKAVKASLPLTHEFSADVVAAIADAFAGHASGVQPDGDDTIITTAFRERRKLADEYATSVVLSPADEEAYWARLDPIDTAVYETRATTVEGVIARLRFAFANTQPDIWSDHAIGDPTCDTFQHGLHSADMFEKLAWSAIEDLARIGGIDLAEQGR